MARRSIIFLVLAVVLLLALGFVMLASASSYQNVGSPDEFGMVWRQAAWLVVSVLAGGACCFTNYQFWRRWQWVLFGLAILTLVLCYVPGFSIKLNGARRWIGLAFLGKREWRVQPSEFAKLVLVIVLAAWYANRETLARTFFTGFLKPVMLIVLFAGLIGAEMDLGSAAICTMLGMAMMIAAGAKLRYMPLIGVSAIAALVALIMITPNRVYRVMSFAADLPIVSKYVKLEELPVSDQKEIAAKGIQQKNSRLAIASGGIEGEGFGQSRMKMYSLPEAHTDFVFALLGEEAGLQGSLSAVLAFVLIVLSGVCISVYAPDRFGKLLGFGITILFGMEGLMNMGVTTSMLPNKGLPLPFVSYGGSSLFVALISIGILGNIFRQGVHVSVDNLTMIRRRKRWTPRL